MIKAWKNDKAEYINTFLKSINVTSYGSLIECWLPEIRSFLWEDDITRWILNWFWLEYLQDFRKDHIKRFSRFVWLSWVPKTFENNEENSIKEMLTILASNNITCTYWLKILWVKWFRRIFKLKDIWKVLYEKYNSIIKNNIWKTITKIELLDIDNIWILLWLKTLNENQHKSDFLILLEHLGIDLGDLNPNKIKADTTIWKNTSFKFLLEMSWGPTDIKKIRVSHIKELKNYLLDI